MTAENPKLNSDIKKLVESIQDRTERDILDDDFFSGSKDTFTDRTQKFLSEGVNRRDINRIKGFRNTWDKFSSLMKAYASIRDGMPPYPNRTNRELVDEFEDSAYRLDLRLIFELQLAHVITRNIYPRLESEAVRQADRVLKKIPGWLAHEYDASELPHFISGNLQGNRKSQVRTIEIVDVAIKEGKLFRKKDDLESSAQLFDWTWSFLSNQIDIEKSKTSFSSTVKALHCITSFNTPFDYEIARKDFGLGLPDPEIVEFTRFLESLYKWSADVLTDPSNPYHESVWSTFDQINQNFKQPAAMFKSLVRIMPREFIRRLHRFAIESGDPSYMFVSEVVDATYVKRKIDNNIVTCQQLREVISLPTQLNGNVANDYTNALSAINQIKHGNDLFSLIKDPHVFEILSLPEDSFFMSFVTFVDDYVVFNIRVRDLQAVENDEGLNKSLRFAVKSTERGPEVTVQLIDEENVDDLTKTCLLFIASRLLQDNIERLGNVEEQSDLEFLNETPSLPLAVFTRRPKGFSQMKGDGDKRKHQIRSQSLMQMNNEANIEYSRTLQVSNFLCWEENQLMDIKQTYRYSGRLMQQFRKKMATFNAGGGYVKSLAGVSNISGENVLEIKCGDYRIIATLLPEGRSQLVDIVQAGEQDLVLGKGN